MAHRTRKKLTKKEIKKDPVAEKLEFFLVFLQTRTKEVLFGLGVVLVIILVAQNLISRGRTASRESMAGFITASQIFSESLGAAASNQFQQAAQGMEASYMMAMQVWSSNPRNEWAQRAGVLAAKVDIIRGNYDRAISTLTDVLVTNPGRATRVSLLLHMGIVLENRGTEQDLVNAAASYSEIIQLTEGHLFRSAVRAEAMYGLSRVQYSQRNFAQSLENLQGALALNPDTTAFEEYRLRELSELALTD